VHNEYLEKYGKYINISFMDLLKKNLTEEINTVTCYQMRTKAVKEFAWAIPNNASIEAIVNYSPLIEMGAGTGYWAKLITEAGGDILAYDIDKPLKKYFRIKKGSYEKLKRYPDRNLFLSWPPYEADMAYNCVKNHKGKYLIYIGEERGGCTGNDDFHEYVDENFELAETLPILQWQGLHDYIFIYKNKLKG
jgi:hypothetical protein